VITDANQVIVWRWDNEDPFGATIASEDPDGDGTTVTCNLRFPGQYFDSETGNHYNYFRDYDPETGRYVQSDPIGLGGGLNTYGYVRGSPTNRFDPFGLAGEDIFGGGGRQPPIGVPDVSQQAQRDLAQQLQQIWNNIFNESEDNESAAEKKEQAIKQCIETTCDPAYDRG